MDLLLPLYNARGYLNFVEIEGVTKIEKAGKTGIPTLKNQKWFIVISSKEKEFTLGYFQSEVQRNTLYKYLMKNKSQPLVEVNYYEYLCESIVSDETASEYITYTLGNHISYVKHYLARNHIDLEKCDAFRGIDLKTFLKHKVDEDLAKTWCQCLPYPKQMQSLGINIYQFYKILIRKHNESFIV